VSVAGGAAGGAAAAADERVVRPCDAIVIVVVVVRRGKRFKISSLILQVFTGLHGWLTDCISPVR
jgi:hypothetical protein